MSVCLSRTNESGGRGNLVFGLCSLDEEHRSLLTFLFSSSRQDAGGNNDHFASTVRGGLTRSSCPDRRENGRKQVGRTKRETSGAVKVELSDACSSSGNSRHGWRGGS